MTEAYLFDIGWLLLAIWSVVVAVVTFSAFGRDLFPPSSHSKQNSPGPSQDLGKAGNSRVRS